jgi:phosphatidylglycerophosphate synthase
MTAGEVWARELLCELRADRYRARAWLRFLVRSVKRARMTRRQRPREHRQVLLAGGAGLVAWAAIAIVRPWLALAGALWWLLLIAMLDWHLGMLEDDEGRVLHRLGLPNLLALGRAGVAPALLVVPPGLLAAILIPAAFTDAVDGSLARARGEVTRLGVWLDGSADGVMLSAAALGTARHGLLAGWVAAVVLARYGAQWLVVALAYFVRPDPPRPAGGLVSARVAGFVLAGGLALAALDLPSAAGLVLVGAAGGAVTLTLGVVRLSRLHPARVSGRER